MQQLAADLVLRFQPPDAVIDAVAKYGNIAIAPLYEPFKAALYANSAISPYMKQLDDFRGSFAKTNPFQAKFPFLESAHIVFFCTMYTVFFFLLPAFIFKFVWKKPLNFLRPIATVHNLFLTMLSFYMAAGIALSAVALGYSFWNNPFNSDVTNKLNWAMVKFQFVFYFSKPVPEFLDTVFITAFQNWRQLSLLHVSHHVSVPVIWWFVMNIAPSGDCHASSFANSFVHIWMYLFFFLMLVSDKEGPIRTWLSNNKYVVTVLQMIQFAHNVAQAVVTLYVVKKTNYEPFLIKLMFGYCSYLLAMFINFFIVNAILGGGGKDKDKSKDSDKKKSKTAQPKQVALVQ